MITSTVKPPETQTSNPRYPYLGIFKLHKDRNGVDSTIVLFYTKDKGILLSDNSLASYKGGPDGMWCEANFMPFDGEITLKNTYE